MVLSRLTKITGPGVSTDTNWVGNNANYTGILTASSLGGIGDITATGIITATKFVGPVEGNVTAVDGTFSGNVSIAGTLTYEDVTNIDSVGIITAPALDVDDFLDVGSNIKLGNAGVITATSFVGDGSGLIGVASTDNIVTGTAATFTGGVDINSDLDVDGHTNLDNVSIAGVTTTGAVSWGGHMLPTSNAAYDIGSADYKVRHLFLSDNSLKFVDSSDTEHPLSVDSGRLKFAGGLLLGSSIKADAVSGIVTATSFVGSGANLTGISQVGGASSVRFNDDVRAFFGTSSSTDCEIVRNSNAVAGQDSLTVKSDLPFIVSTNNLSNIQFYVNNNSGNNGLIFDNNGLKPSSNDSVKLGSNSYKYNSVYAVNVFATTLFGDGSNLTGISQVGGSTGVDFNDNVKARFGTGNDLEIFHNTNDDIINASGSGNLKLQKAGSTKIEVTGTGAQVAGSLNITNALTVSNNITGSNFIGDGSNLSGVLKNIVEDTSPQLGGNLASNGNLIKFADSNGTTNRLTFGNGDDIQIRYQTSNLYITQATGDIIIENTGTNTSNQIYINGKANNNSIVVHGNGAVELYDQSSGSASKKFETTSGGTKVSGLMEADRTRNVPITTTQRNALSSPAEGTMIYNSTLKKLQVYTDSQWVSFSGKQINVGGGSISNNGTRSGYVVHTFTSPGTFTTSASLEGVEIMVVGGGGGGGGHRYGSGGGAGGVIMRPGSSPTPAYPLSSPAPVVVGAGGNAGAQNGTAGGGSNSTFGSGPMQLIGKGGGGGTSYDGPVYPGRPGGSGSGGTSRASNSPGGSATQPGTHGAGTDYGNRGGNYTVPGGGWAPGGGGGAGANGMDTPGQQNGGGNGGAGVPLSITGSATYYAGGGAGGIYNSQGSGSNWYGIGGNGGGGSSWNSVPGSYPGHSAPGAGAANSGGGGCGAHGQNPSSIPINNALSAGKAGGSGIVIVAYPTTQPEGEVVT